MLLGGLDNLFVGHAYHSTITKGASVQLVFGFEVFNISFQVSNIVMIVGLTSYFYNAVRDPSDSSHEYIYQICPTHDRSAKRQSMGK